MSNQALFEKLDQTTELLSTKLIELIRLSSIEDPDDDSGENPISEISVATTGVTMVNNQSMQLIKGVQDLLVLTRNIREKWLLNQIPEQQEAEATEIDPSELEDLLERCIQEVIGDSNVEVNSQISQSPTT